MSKDVTRSIRLDGDVKEIAQKLADDKMLSKTLSKLLRQHYGMHDEITSIKQQLDRTVNERMLLQEEEKILADKIDELENVKLKRQMTDLPHAQRRLDKLYDLFNKTNKEWSEARDTQTRVLRARQLRNQDQLIKELEAEIEAMS